jgi:hypothetical protein
MCFSATASFATAGLAATLGLVALGRKPHRHEGLLAGMPLFFAVQQAAEGALWLALERGGDAREIADLTLFFVFMAEAFWPAYASFAVYRAERDRQRARLIRMCLATGIALSLYLIWGVISRPQKAEIELGHIVYQAEFAYPQLLGLIYLGTTGLPMLLSSQRVVALLGAVVTMGSATAFLFYTEAYISVWCFFAAASSGLIVFHFERARRQRLVLHR